MMGDEKHKQEPAEELEEGEIEDDEVCVMVDNNGKRGRKRKNRDKDKSKGQQNKKIGNTGKKFKVKDDDARKKRTEQEQQPKEAQGICVFYMQSKCQNKNCLYSHNVTPPMKLELCKFYLENCCAKGNKCTYMHSEFPCKFYHTGMQCLEGENCKFAHGEALSDRLKQILYRHIDTAPQSILSGFPRMSGEKALDMINSTQTRLAREGGQKTEQHGGSSSDKEGGPGPSCGLFDMNMSEPVEFIGRDRTKSGNRRNRSSKWQQDMPQQEPKTQSQSGLSPVGFLAQDQDMRVSPNGDTDMRSLVSLLPQSIESSSAIVAADDTSEMMEQQQQKQRKEDTDIRIVPFGDVDMRPNLSDLDTRVSPELSEQNLPNLPETQHDLDLRIQAEPNNFVVASKPSADAGMNLYCDDSDEEQLVINLGDDETNKGDITKPAQVSPKKFDLGHFTKIDISAEVTKLLMRTIKSKESETNVAINKPATNHPSTMKKRRNHEEKLSIYQQGSLNNEKSRTTKPDVNLKNLALPFKGMANYTPAKEIDAWVSSHKPIAWSLPVEEDNASVHSHRPIGCLLPNLPIPAPDYTGSKLDVQNAEETFDPRLRKVLPSTDEIHTPMSPEPPPKVSTTIRIDPRLKKLEAEKQSDDSTNHYTQRLNMLTSSAFYQSLTSSQKLLLNQELASRKDQDDSHDSYLNSILSKLNLTPNLNQTGLNALGNATALAILHNVNKLNPIMPAARQNVLMNQMAQSMVQPGLLGAAPGIPNLPPDFSINFDPRNSGLLGNAPPPINNNLGNAPPPFFQGPGNGIGNAGNFQSFPKSDFYNQRPPQQNQQQNFHSRNASRGFNNRRRGGNSFRNNNNNNNNNRNNFNDRRDNRNNRNPPQT